MTIHQWNKTVRFNRKAALNSSKGVKFRVSGRTRYGFRFGFLNIYSHENFEPCYTLGDIYAWNVSDWKVDKDYVYEQDLFHDEVCLEKPLMKIWSSFDQILNFYNIIGGGVKMLNGGFDLNLIPFKYENGQYVNIYSNTIFNGSWCEGQPNGVEEKCIIMQRKNKCCENKLCDKPYNSFFQLTSGTTFTLR